MTPDRFAAHVEAHGGDIDRWPEASRAPARRRLAVDVHAVRLLAEARALDRLLALAPVTASPPGMVDQIVARARRERHDAESHSSATATVATTMGNGKVVPLPIDARGRQSTMTRGTDPGSVIPRRQVFGGGSMLAASLLMGIWLGASGAAAPSFSNVFPMRQSAKTLDAMSEIVQTALPVDLIDGTDEDTL